VRSRTFRRAGLGLLTLVLAAVAGISTADATSTTVPGHAVPGMTPADLDTLEFGPYAANPADYRPALDSVGAVYQVEARRMFGYVADPSDIAPGLNFLSDVEIIASDAIGIRDNDHLLPRNFPAIAAARNFIGGVVVGRNNRSGRARESATIALLRFPDEVAARAAAADINGALGSPGRHPIPIAGPDAQAGSADNAIGQLVSVRGPYVVVGQARVSRPDPVALAARLSTLAQAQFAAMAELTPTPLDDIPDLPQDRDAMMRRALTDPGGVSALDYANTSLQGAYGPRAALHFEDDAALMRRVFAGDGVDLVAQNAGKIYRTRDLDAAFRLQATLTIVGPDDRELANPPGITDAHCVQRGQADPATNAQSVCVVVYGRYVGLVGAGTVPATKTPDALYQRAAAQYSILARSR